MLNEILKKYDVAFFKKSILGRNVLGVTSISLMLSQYISDCDNVVDTDILLEAIDGVIKEETDRIINSSNSLATIDINIDVAKFYDDPGFDNNTQFFSLPTSDFKEIVLAWRAFLLLNA
jgi:hypothetical protein